MSSYAGIVNLKWSVFGPTCTHNQCWGTGGVL